MLRVVAIPKGTTTGRPLHDKIVYLHPRHHSKIASSLCYDWIGSIRFGGSSLPDIRKGCLADLLGEWSEKKMAGLSLALLGSFQAQYNGQAVQGFRSDKVQALLIYLATERNRTHSRERLMTMLWPGMPEGSARHNLRQVLYHLRRTFPELASRSPGASPEDDNPVPLLISDRRTIWLNPQGDVEVDVDRFEQLIDRAQVHDHPDSVACLDCRDALEEAVALYRGDFLEDFYLEDSNQFEDWVVASRENYRRNALDALETLATTYIHQEEYKKAQGYAMHQLEIDRLRESANRQLMEVLFLQGERTSAVRHYHIFTQTLEEELGLRPSPETMALYEHIRTGKLEGATSAKPSKSLYSQRESIPQDQPFPLSLSLYDTRPPQPLTPLFGRKEEIASLKRILLRPDIRLLTMIGPPGVGKTRLALYIASDLSEDFPDGVVFVDLSSVLEPDHVLQALAQALNIRERAGFKLVDGLRKALWDRETLLVLDNFEHVIEESPDIAVLLSATPGAKALITSREALRVSGEIEFPVLPFPLPDPDQLSALFENPAVQLFTRCAQAVQPSFQVTQENAPVIADILTRLDGLPLAIELAAARVKLFSPEAMLEHMDQRLHWLTSGKRDDHMRQQTLRNAIDWSYHLLNPIEKRLFAILGVFSGGFTVDAVSKVSSELDPYSTIERLATLVDKSLVIPTQGVTGIELRFSLLNSIQKYVQERLAEDKSSLDAAQRAHMAYYLDLAETAEPELRGSQQRVWLDRLEIEHNNLRAALMWACDNQEAGLALRMSGALWHFWERHSHLSDGRRWLDRALALDATPTPEYLAQRAKALNGAGKLANDQGDTLSAQRLCRDSLALWEELGPAGDLSIPHVLNMLGIIAQSQSDLPSATTLHRKALNLARQNQDRVQTYIALYNLAELIAQDGDFAEADTLHAESLELKREQGDTWSIAWSLASLARLALQRKDFDQARLLYQESLKLRLELGDRWSLAESLLGLARTALNGQEIERAAQFYFASQALFERLGITLSPNLQTQVEKDIAFLHSQLGEKHLTAIIEEGRDWEALVHKELSHYTGSEFSGT